MRWICVTVLLVIAATEVRAEKGDQLYGDLVARGQVRKMQARIEAAYSSAGIRRCS